MHDLSPIVDMHGNHFDAAGTTIDPGYRYEYHNGEKYEGGLGPVPVLYTDYWALRERSAAFFKTNLYGRGIIRRFVTNVINTGLSLDAEPILGLLSIDEDKAAEWSEDVEDKFLAWASLPQACDWVGEKTFGEMQREIYREALIEGDVLVIEHHNAATNLPYYEIVSGSLVTSPLVDVKIANGHCIEHGVELNAKRQQVAYWVLQADLTHKRIPSRGRNNRLLSWLFYATDKRAFDVRGEPLLSLIMQSIGEIDKYRDSTQRKATVNSMLAMFFYQSADSKVPNSRPVTAGAARRVAGTEPAADGTDYKLNMAGHRPGLVYEYLPPGVEPKGFGSEGTDEKFGEFEDAIVDGLAWGLEMPKSVLKMLFSNSYSASRGEVKEFNLTLGAIRNRFSDTLTRRVYRSWLTAMVLTRRVEAPGMLAAWRDSMQFDVFAAWTNSNWWGAVKEAVDLVKEVTGLGMMADRGYTTNSANARAMTNTRFSANMKKVARENKLIAESVRPMLELNQQFGNEAVQAALGNDVRLAAVANGGDIDG